MNEDDNRKPYRLGRRPGEQGPRPLSSNQDRIEKLTTGKTGTKTGITTRQIVTNKTAAAVTSNVKSGQQQSKITKDTLTVGTWNVQTLWATRKLELLRNEMKRFRFDVIRISEVRWTGKGERPSGDFIWSGEDTTHQRTHVYAPTSASPDDEIEIFYDRIEHALTQTPKKDIIIVTGDWNAKIGSDNTHWESVMGRYGYGDRNERGDRLLEFAAIHNLYICNTRFQQKSNRKWTWASPDGVHKNMINLVLIQKRWKSSVTNCRTFQSADISSDHSLVLCNIKLRLKRRCIKSQQYHRADVSQLKSQKVREVYQTRLVNRLQDIDTQCNLEEHAAKVEEAIKDALQATVTTTRRVKKPWILEQTLNLADEKRKMKQIKNVSAENGQLYKNLCSKVKKSARQDKDNWIQDKCNEIENGLKIGNTRQAYSLIKTLKNNFVPRITMIRNQDGTMQQSKEGVTQRWTQYCSGLYKHEGGGDEMVKELEGISPSYKEDPQDILYSEVEEAIRTLRFFLDRTGPAGRPA
ncbi:unnamed protein product [Rotaria magnacalcarata]|uniref:Endonuclease/exonuclease/phosphatase domain-containing protein n=1 Tax=Rotaria magnacalcarata TaxID=392030 RepID=A0A816NX02_9BILA|nr:unnamed protein product [Rotaria magnacalcarata]